MVKKNVEIIFSILIYLSSVLAVFLGIMTIVDNFYSSIWILLAVFVFGILVPPLLSHVSQSQRLTSFPARFRLFSIAMFSVIVILIKIFPHGS